MSESKKWFAQGRHLNDVGVSLYVDALKLERTSDLPEEILLHVQKCQKCKVEIMGLYTVLQDQDYFRSGPHPFFDAQGPAYRERGIAIYRIAAGFAIIVTLAAVAYYLGYLDVSRKTPASTSNLEHSVSIDTSARGAKHGQPSTVDRQRLETADYAARFVTSPDLESLVNGQLRSAHIEVISPVNGNVLKREILFKWEGGEPPFTLVVMSNTEQPKKKVTLNGSHFLLKDVLDDGLYYWKLEANGELLYLGKFMVKSQKERQ